VQNNSINAHILLKGDMGLNTFFKEFIMFIKMIKDRNIQWCVGSQIVALLVFNIFIDNINDSVFYSQIVLVLVGMYRVHLMRKKNAKN
jgi:hypothetical protein